MISSMQSSLSALQAYGTRLAANAHNIANSSTEGFKRTSVTLENTAPNGVRAVVAKSQNQGPMVYNQTSSGLELIEQSNVDISRELPDMMLNTNFYKANLKALQTADELLSNVLDLKA